METAGFHERVAGKAFPRDISEIFRFARLSFLIHTICTYTINTPITHICWGVLLRENPNHKPWELEIVILTIFYTIASGFSLTPTSPFSYPWEVDSPNTYHTLSECLVRFLVLLGSIRRSQGWQMQNGACCGIRRARQDTILRSLVGVRAWRA